MSGGKVVTLQLLRQEALECLRSGDLAGAGRSMGLDLPPFFLHENWLWEIRLEQLRRSPADAPWLVRAAVLEPDGVVVGHAGFHGPPDEHGMVEIGYTVVPDQRGKGYAHLLLSALLQDAASTRQVRTVRATVASSNLPSLAVVTAAGFTYVGEQWDDVDGTELIFER